MDKNTGLYIVLGFLLLCILLSLDKKEGFATINVSQFETACNAGENTCIVAHAGALGSNCLPSPDEHLYNLSPGEEERDTHKQSFNITVDSCSDSAYPIPGQTISAQVCSNEGQPYTLSGCAANCSRPADSIPGYQVALPQYVSPIETDSNGTLGIRDIGEGSCVNGLIAARNTCFNRDGSINGANSETTCSQVPGIWYDDSGTNSIKLVCDLDINPNYSVIGCESACLSRDSELDEYMATTPGDLSSPDKEIIQILHRTNPVTTPDTGPATSDTEVIMPQGSATPYLMEESSLNPGNFIVTGTHQSTNFSGQSETPIPIDFAGVVESSQGCNLSSPNTDLQRKYPVSGLFPVCNSQTHECLNFNITYDNTPTDKLNITDFKNTMDTSATEIGIPQAEIENYQNSLYYYRRYKDRDDKTHIEGQIRCNNDPTSPFHCIITDPDPITWILGGAGQNCNSVCDGINSTCITPYIGSEAELKTKMGEFGHGDCGAGGYSSQETFPMGPSYYAPTNTCAFSGISEEELQDVYSCDESIENVQRICKCQRE